MSDMKENLELLSRGLYRLPVAELTDEQLHAVVARAVLARLQPAWQGSLQAHCAGRRAYYFSAEYLLGKAVYNNLLCTGLTGEVEAALTACGRKLDQLDCVPDPPLGNGGFGTAGGLFFGQRRHAEFTAGRLRLALSVRTVSPADRGRLSGGDGGGRPAIRRPLERVLPSRYCNGGIRRFCCAGSAL